MVVEDRDEESDEAPEGVGVEEPPPVELMLGADEPDAVAVAVVDWDEEGEEATEGVGGMEVPPTTGLTLDVDEPETVAAALAVVLPETVAVGNAEPLGVDAPVPVRVAEAAEEDDDEGEAPPTAVGLKLSLAAVL